MLHKHNVSMTGWTTRTIFGIRSLPVIFGNHCMQLLVVKDLHELTGFQVHRHSHTSDFPPSHVILFLTLIRRRSIPNLSGVLGSLRLIRADGANNNASPT